MRGGQDLCLCTAGCYLGKHRERDICVHRRQNGISVVGIREKRRDLLGKVCLWYLRVSLRLIPLPFSVGKPGIVNLVIRFVIVVAA